MQITLNLGENIWPAIGILFAMLGQLLVVVWGAANLVGQVKGLREELREKIGAAGRRLENTETRVSGLERRCFSNHGA